MTSHPETLPPGSFLKRRDGSALYLGAAEDGHELWLTPEQVKTHIFVSGSTGSGKSELLVSLAANAMAWGSGVTIVDGKADISLFAKIHAIATAMGREDDLYLLNFMGSAAETRSSHTVNPLATMTAEEICQLVSGSIDQADKSGNHDMWRSRAIAMVTAVIKALAWMRDTQGDSLTFSSLRDSTSLEGFMELADRCRRDNAPASVRNALDSYLKSLPGYKASKGTEQNSTTNEQHGYLAMQFTRLFGLLADGFGHVFGNESPDVDFADVVLNRRILVVLLPSLEKSSNDIATIGRIIVGLLKSMMGQALKTEIDGDWNALVERRPTSARKPYLVLLDEVGHYMTDGMGLMAAQARSLGIGLVFATQDVHSMAASSPRETAAILANTNTKLHMKCENPFEKSMAEVLTPFTAAESEAWIQRERLLSIRESRIKNRMNYGRSGTREVDVAALQAISSELEIQAISSQNVIERRLLSFRPGEMFVTHGGDYAFARANHIRIDGDGHRIGIAKFFPTESHTWHYEDTKENTDRIDAAMAAAKPYQEAKAVNWQNEAMVTILRGAGLLPKAPEPDKRKIFNMISGTFTEVNIDACNAAQPNTGDGKTSWPVSKD